MKPGMSTRQTREMLKASHKRTKQVALAEAWMSSTSASAAGWLAMSSMVWPPRRPKPQMMLRAK